MIDEGFSWVDVHLSSISMFASDHASPSFALRLAFI